MAIVAKMICHGVEAMSGIKTRVNEEGAQVVLCSDGQWYPHSELQGLREQEITPILGEIASEKVRLSAVYQQSPSDTTNAAWSAATPSGMLELLISNSDAHGKIKPGRTYFVEIREEMPGRSRS